MLFRSFDYRASSGTFFEAFIMNFTGVYGQSSLNLNTLINPHIGFDRNCDEYCPISNIDASVINNFSISKLDFGGTTFNYEGFLYLGSGLVFLSILVFFNIRLSKLAIIIRNNSFLFSTMLVYTISILLLGITNHISIGNHLFGFELPKVIRWGLSAFRASPRFSWILVYGFIVFLFFSLSQKYKGKTLNFVLVLTFLFQAIDLSEPIINRFIALRHEVPIGMKLNTIPSTQFENLANKRKVFVLLPTGSRKGFPELSYLAYKNGLSTSLSESSRVNWLSTPRIFKEKRELVCSGQLPNSWLLAIPKDEIEILDGCDIDNYVKKEIGDFVFFTT